MATDSLRMFALDQAVKIVTASAASPCLLSPRGSEPDPAEIRPDGHVVYNYVGVGAPPQVVLMPRSPEKLTSEATEIARRLIAFIEGK